MWTLTGEGWGSVSDWEALCPVLHGCVGQPGTLLLGHGMKTVFLGLCFCEARTLLPYPNKRKGQSGLSSAVHGA